MGSSVLQKVSQSEERDLYNDTDNDVDDANDSVDIHAGTM